MDFKLVCICCFLLLTVTRAQPLLGLLEGGNNRNCGHNGGGNNGGGNNGGGNNGGGNNDGGNCGGDNGGGDNGGGNGCGGGGGKDNGNVLGDLLNGVSALNGLTVALR